MSNFINIMENFCMECGIEMSGIQYKKFEEYKNNLLDWNEKINLTAIVDDVDIIIKHFIDSLSCKSLISKEYKLIDIGSGAGFPGLPLKIYFGNDFDVTLLDSLNKRINFLNDCIQKLDLKNIKAFHGRAEDFGKDVNFREKYDICISRAVANLKILCEYSLPFVKRDGIFLAMKGSDVENEIEEAKEIIDLLGGKLEDIIDIKLPSEINHTIVVIKKVKDTPIKYPRKMSEIKRLNKK